MALTDGQIKKAIREAVEDRIIGTTTAPAIQLWDRAKTEDGTKTNGEAGLYLHVNTESGAARWCLKCRLNGRPMLKGLGVYSTVSLALARDKAKEIRSSMAAGIDPKAKTDAPNNFEQVAKLWHEKWSVGKAPRHAATVLRRLQEPFKAFGKRAMDSIEAKDIVALMSKIQERGARDIAVRAHQTTGQVFEFAIAHGWAKRNPTKDFRPSVVVEPTETKHIASVKADELPALLTAIEQYTEKNQLTGLAVQLLAHTFVRTGELRHAE